MIIVLEHCANDIERHKASNENKIKQLQILYLTRLEEFEEQFNQRPYEHNRSKNKDTEYFKKKI